MTPSDAINEIESKYTFEATGNKAANHLTRDTTMDDFPKRFQAWWNKIGNKLPYTKKCIALAAYQYGRASRDLESRPTLTTPTTKVVGFYGHRTCNDGAT
jgi:hypothetical protein